MHRQNQLQQTRKRLCFFFFFLYLIHFLLFTTSINHEYLYSYRRMSLLRACLARGNLRGNREESLADRDPDELPAGLTTKFCVRADFHHPSVREKGRVRVYGRLKTPSIRLDPITFTSSVQLNG